MPIIPEGIASGGIWPAVSAAGIWTALFTAFGMWLKQRPAMTQAQAEVNRAKVAADASLREDLMRLMNDQHAQHTAEVAQLKAEQAAERLRCSEDMAALRREAQEDRARLEGEIKGLRDQLLQLHKSTGAAIQFGFNAPEALASAPRVEKIARQRRRRTGGTT